MKAIIHGGHGNYSEDRLAISKKALESILNLALEESASKESAVEIAVRLACMLEDDPLFNAGTGSRLQQDRKIRMAASIMDSGRGKFAAVLNVQNVRNPITIARNLLDEESTVVTGDSPFVSGLNLPHHNVYTDERLKEWEAHKKGKSGTVGAVVMDNKGLICTVNSTGGRGFETPGRVSDSGYPAANYASGSIGITCTGYGERIRDICVAPAIIYLRENGFHLQKAIDIVFKRLEEAGGECGIIGIDKSEGIFHRELNGRMPWASDEL